MFLTISQVILLLANSGSINRVPEPVVNEQAVSLDEIKSVETDLKKVIKILKNIKTDSDVKDDLAKANKIKDKSVEVLPEKIEKIIEQVKKINKQDEIKAVETDLRKVIKTLNNINADSDVKDDRAKANKIEDKSVEVLSEKIEKVVEQIKKINKQGEIKAVETDLRKVIKTLNHINADSDVKDDKTEDKSVGVLPVKAKKEIKVVEQDKTIERSKQKLTESKQAATIENGPVVEKPVVAISNTRVASSLNESVYIKYDMNGKELNDNNEKWTCVQDTKNGLMWEVKSKDDNMRKPDNLYSWFDPENKTLKGVTDGGRCMGDTDCDTHAYIKSMNQKNFCGHNDWRLPTREEMFGLVNFIDASDNVKINASYFPETLPSWYWTASSNVSHPEFAWYILFNNGVSLNDLKENPKHIRLVRDESSS